MLLRRLQSSLRRIAKPRLFSSQNSANSNFEAFLAGLKKQPSQSTAQKVEVKRNLLDENSDETSERLKLRNLNSQSASREGLGFSKENAGERVFRAQRAEEIDPERYYEDQKVSTFKQGIEDSVNFQHSEEGIQYKKWLDVAKQRSQKIAEYTLEIQKHTGQLPLTEREALWKKLGALRERAIKIIKTRRVNRRLYTVDELKKIDEWEQFLKEVYGKLKVDPKQVKEYPGSSRGPRPEDDPEHYAAWWDRNKPKMFTDPLYYELQERLEAQKGQYSEILEKLRGMNAEMESLKTTAEDTMNQAESVMNISLLTTFFTGGDPGVDSNGAMTLSHDDKTLFRDPDKENLTQEEKELPPRPQSFQFGSWMGLDNEDGLPFQPWLDTQVNERLINRWTQIVQPEYTRELISSLRLMNRICDPEDPLNWVTEEGLDPETGHMVTRKVFKPVILTEIRRRMGKLKPQQGLLHGGYYDLLPSNVRSHIAVRNLAVVGEFRHTREKTWRQKETLLNMAASLVLPVKQEFQELIIENMAAKVPQMNDQRIKEMMYELEQEDIPSDDDEIFDDECFIEYLHMDFPEETFDQHFELWAKKEKVKAVRRVYEDLEKTPKGDYVGMPAGWRPWVYSEETNQMLEQKIEIKKEDDSDQEEEEYTVQQLLEAGELAIQKSKMMGEEIVIETSSGDSEDEEERLLRKQERIQALGEEYLSVQKKEVETMQKDLKKLQTTDQKSEYQGLADHPIKAIKNPIVSQAEKVAEPPIDFFDNEDGFWDEFIAERRQRNFGAMEINFLPRLKH